MRRWLLTIAGVLSLVTIGGQCRGALAQTKPNMAAVSLEEWQKSFDACLKDGGMPVVKARRDPGVSAGVGCAQALEGWQ